jgi:hypothetical protein
MVPVFAGALKKSASDNNRVTATSLAQERIERIRQLDYKDITTSNLNSATYPNNRKWFVPSTTDLPNYNGKPYTFLTDVVYADAPADSPPGTLAPYKTVTVAVKWNETYNSEPSSHETTVTTVVKNPDAITMFSKPIPGPFAVTASFLNWDDVSYVCIIRKLPLPEMTVSSLLRPSGPAPNDTVSWPRVEGGYGITYVVRCTGIRARLGGGPFTYDTDPFHLLSNGPFYFDTDPGYPSRW